MKIDLTALKRKLKKLDLRPQSMTYIIGVVTISTIPFVLGVYAWLTVWITRDTSEFAFRMQDQLLKMIDTFFEASVVGGLIAYVPYLINKNRNGVPDILEGKKEKKDEDNHTGPTEGPGPGSQGIHLG